MARGWRAGEPGGEPRWIRTAEHYKCDSCGAPIRPGHMALHDRSIPVQSVNKGIKGDILCDTPLCGQHVHNEYQYLKDINFGEQIDLRER
jgi:hypothetical protein